MIIFRQEIKKDGNYLLIMHFPSLFLVTEGVYLRNFGIDPYSGDLFHETPIGLVAFNLMQKFLTDWALKLLFILTDLTTAWFLAATARTYFTEVVNFLLLIFYVKWGGSKKKLWKSKLVCFFKLSLQIFSAF